MNNLDRQSLFFLSVKILTEKYFIPIYIYIARRTCNSTACTWHMNEFKRCYDIKLYVSVQLNYICRLDFLA